MEELPEHVLEAANTAFVFLIVACQPSTRNSTSCIPNGATKGDKNFKGRGTFSILC